MSDLPPIVLVFAATDPSGGAGLQADIMTLSSMGCHPLSVVTAVTIQDTMGVDDISPIDTEWVADQARCVLEDMPVAAFKIGLLGNVEQIAAIAEVVSDYPEVPLVLDPVLAGFGALVPGPTKANADGSASILYTGSIVVPCATLDEDIGNDEVYAGGSATFSGSLPQFSRSPVVNGNW